MPETPARRGNRRQRGLPGRRRRTSLKRVLLSLVATVLIVLAGAGATALWALKELREPGPLSQSTNVVIEPGLRTHEIAERLENEGVVAHDWLFALAAHLSRPARGSLKAGEYAFPPGASMAQVLGIIRSGRAVVHKVTIPEGWTSARAVEIVNEHPALTGTVAEVPPEGSLLPDTYVFQRGTTRQDLIERMRRAQQEVLDELWPQRDPDLPIKSREEAVILASIVEKETGIAEERRRVAAVFLNRLRQNMRLQSDPTIIYGIVGGSRLDRPISRSDIAEETPYNTYRIDGLPPTPIANPGRAAIAAVLQPDTSEHLYFVADGTGGHVFAKTYKEHQENVRRWRQIEQATRQEAGSEGEPATIQISAESDETVAKSEDTAPIPEPDEPRRAEADVTTEQVQEAPDGAATAGVEAGADADPAAEAPQAPGQPEAGVVENPADATHPPVEAEAATAEPEPSPVEAEAATAEPDPSPGEDDAARLAAVAAEPKPQPPDAAAPPAAGNVPLPRPKPQRD